jgi:hypothetical protein
MKIPARARKSTANTLIAVEKLVISRLAKCLVAMTTAHSEIL